MRAVLLIAAAVGIALVLMAQVSSIPLPGLPPRVTCSLPEEACPEVSWSGDIRWANDTPTIRSIEFRELPPEWGIELPFEPEWAASIENYFDPTQTAACRSDPRGGVECHYLEYGGDPEDLPWYVPTPRERQLAWCRDPENIASMYLTAYELDIGQGPDPAATVFHQEYNEWQHNGGEFTKNLDRACRTAYESR
jgi:hypothetical protein